MNQQQRSQSRTKTITNPRVYVRQTNQQQLSKQQNSYKNQVFQSPKHSQFERQNQYLNKFSHMNRSTEIKGNHNNFMVLSSEAKNQDNFQLSNNDLIKEYKHSQNNQTSQRINSINNSQLKFQGQQGIQKHINFSTNQINQTNIESSKISTNKNNKIQFIKNQFQKNPLSSYINQNFNRKIINNKKSMKDFQIQSENNVQSDDDYSTLLNTYSKWNLQRNQIILTVQQRTNNSLQMTQKMQQNTQIMVQNPLENYKNKNNYEVTTREVTFPLSQIKLYRQLRKLTPIKSLKKYILNLFGYSQGARNCQKINLSFYNLTQTKSNQIIYPIQNQENLELILSQFIKAKKDLFLRFQHAEKLAKKYQRNKKIQNFQVQFDSDGQLQDDSSEQQLQEGQNELNEQIKLIKQTLKVNKTQKSKYKGQNVVRCAFCSKTNKQIDSIKKCGPFYGPFLKGRKKVKQYCHLLCALWCKKVYLDDELQLKAITQQITRSQNKNCQYCQKSGAGLLCQTCTASMHYECGLGRCKYNWPTYELHCQNCAQDINREMQIQEIVSSNIENSLQSSRVEQNQKMEIQNVNQLVQNQLYQVNSQIRTHKLQQNNCQMNITNNIQQNSALNLQKLEVQNSRTISVPVPSRGSRNNNLLSMDSQSRLSINNDDSVQIIQQRHKAGNPNLSIYQVKFQEEQLQNSSNNRRSQRRGKQGRK